MSLHEKSRDDISEHSAPPSYSRFSKTAVPIIHTTKGTGYHDTMHHDIMHTPSAPPPPYKPYGIQTQYITPGGPNQYPPQAVHVVPGGQQYGQSYYVPEQAIPGVAPGQNVVVVAQPPPNDLYCTSEYRSFTGLFVLVLFVTLLCGVLFGVIAFIFACKLSS